jgi:hypothetical protein
VEWWLSNERRAAVFAAQTGEGLMAAENGAEDRTTELDRTTERVILERTRAIVLSDDVTEDVIVKAIEVLNGTKRRRATMRDDAWIEVARHVAGSKKAAIRIYAGAPGTADAKVGEWRAPTVTAWKDGVRHVAPPKPLIEAEAVE